MAKNIEQTEFINAAGAAYAWMCVSDGKITPEESEGFSKCLNELPYVKDLTHEDFVSSYLEILNAFEVDFDDGYCRTVTRIEPLKNDKKAAFDIIKIARRALVSDGEVNDIEEGIMTQLCEMLNVSEDEVI